MTAVDPQTHPTNLLDVLRVVTANAPAPELDARVIVHVGAQELRLPARQVVGLCNEAIAWLENWTRTADGPASVFYTTVKGAVNFLYPFLPGMLSGMLGVRIELPKRPRHTDPILFVLRYLVELVAPYLALGEWTVEPTDDGRIGEAHVDLAGQYRVMLYQAAEEA